MTQRPLASVSELPTHRMNELFSARRTQGVDLDPFLNNDLFHMSGPVFAPHPHAGFSAVTYLLDDSTSPMHNLDSLGDDGLIQPGGVHWTVAGSGIVHNEYVEHPGRMAHGAQIFVGLPVDSEEVAPSSTRFTPQELPVIAIAEGSRIRVVAGQLMGQTSPVDEPAGVQLYDVTLRPNERLELPFDPAFRGFFMTVDGAAQVSLDEQHLDLGPTGLVVFEPGDGSIAVTASAIGVRLLVGAGQPIRTPGQWNGGFHFTSRSRLAAAVERYQRGELHGALATA